MSLRYRLAGLLAASALFATAHAATMNEATVQAIMPLVKKECEAARDNPGMQKLGIEVDKFCECSSKKAAGYYRTANLKSPNKPTEEDKALVRSLTDKALGACIKPYMRSSIVREITAICQTGNGGFSVLAEQGAQEQQAACQCVGTIVADETLVPDETTITTRPGVDSKTVVLAAIESCKPLK